MNMDDFFEELHVMQLSDSFFPTGLFATSNGLETIFFDRKLTSSQELVEFSRVIIEQQLGPSDCIVLANAYNFAKSSDYDKIMELDEMYCSFRTIKEMRDASIRSGSQLVKCIKEFLNEDQSLNWFSNCLHDRKISGTYPVSFAICCNALGITKEKVLLMFLYGFVTSTVGAALRLGMIQHLEGQRIIHQLKPLMIKIVKENLNKQVADIWQFAPQIEIFQMQHEKMDSKMFIT